MALSSACFLSDISRADSAQASYFVGTTSE
jgi:hypothetical protein